MALKMPESMDDCLYFTNRTINDSPIIAWVYRKECPKCHKAKMGKPVVKGKVKTRAAYYECPACSYQEQKEEHEHSLHLEAQYTCPECGKEGESTGVYQRKSFKGVKAYVLECEHCQTKLPITKKLKEIIDKYTANIPKKVNLNLPKLKKVKDNKESKLTLPKLKKV